MARDKERVGIATEGARAVMASFQGHIEYVEEQLKEERLQRQIMERMTQAVDDIAAEAAAGAVARK